MDNLGHKNVSGQVTECTVSWRWAARKQLLSSTLETKKSFRRQTSKEGGFGREEGGAGHHDLRPGEDEVGPRVEQHLGREVHDDPEEHRRQGPS